MNNIIVNKISNTFNLKMNVPGSKSLTLRDLCLAALADGTSIIDYPADCNDTDVMVAGLIKFGAKISKEGSSLVVTGIKEFSEGRIELDLGGSGISARFLLAMSVLRNSPTYFTGNASLSARPQGYLLECLRELGAEVKDNSGRLPIEIIPNKNLLSKKIKMKGDISSQFFSALFQIAPLFPNGLDVDVDGDLVSKPYIDLTISELKKFGIEITNNNYQSFNIKQQLFNPAKITVEGDASGASYFLALALLHNSEITISNLSSNSLQGDLKFVQVLERLGAKVDLNKDFLKLTGNNILNKLPEVDFESMPDVAPTLMMIAPFVKDGIRITGLGTLRLKECDRIAVPVSELAKLGINCQFGNDWIYVPELKHIPDSSNVSIDTYDDHRIAMSFAVLGSKLGNLTINDPRCVGKTYPNFWEELEKLYV